jgi:hypothetical protein
LKISDKDGNHIATVEKELDPEGCGVIFLVIGILSILSWIYDSVTQFIQSFDPSALSQPTKFTYYFYYYLLVKPLLLAYSFFQAVFSIEPTSYPNINTVLSIIISVAITLVFIIVIYKLVALIKKSPRVEAAIIIAAISPLIIFILTSIASVLIDWLMLLIDWLMQQ